MSSTDTDHETPRPDEASTEPQRTRIRYSATALAPLMVGVICAIPLSIALGPWGLLVLLPFVLAALALFRVGADITDEAVTVRGALGSTTIPRAELVGLEVPDGRHVHLVRADGSTVRIPSARPRDLPRFRTLLFPDSVTDRPEE